MTKQVDVALEANLVVELSGLLHTVTSTISPLSRTVRSLLQVVTNKRALIEP